MSVAHENPPPSQKCLSVAGVGCCGKGHGGPGANVRAPGVRRASFWAYDPFSPHCPPPNGRGYVAKPPHLGDPKMAGFMYPLLVGDMD